MDLEALKKELAEAAGMRDRIKKGLEDKPFLKVEIRKQFQSTLAVLEAKIKKIQGDITYIELMGSATPEEIENIQVAAHFQHYRK
jgi:hypothetical protein